MEVKFKFNQKKNTKGQDKTAPKEYKQNTFTVPDSRKKETGKYSQYGKGNIDLYDRPIYRNPDGKISTVRSANFEIDGKQVLLPTIAKDKNGKAVKLTDDQAVQRYFDTGEYLGKFNTVEESNAYAEKLHKDQDAYYNKKAPKYSSSGRDIDDYKSSGRDFTAKPKKLTDENSYNDYLDYLREKKENADSELKEETYRKAYVKAKDDWHRKFTEEGKAFTDFQNEYGNDLRGAALRGNEQAKQLYSEMQNIDKNYFAYRGADDIDLEEYSRKKNNELKKARKELEDAQWAYKGIDIQGLLNSNAVKALTGYTFAGIPTANIAENILSEYVEKGKRIETGDKEIDKKANKALEAYKNYLEAGKRYQRIMSEKYSADAEIMAKRYGIDPETFGQSDSDWEAFSNQNGYDKDTDFKEWAKGHKQTAKDLKFLSTLATQNKARGNVESGAWSALWENVKNVLETPVRGAQGALYTGKSLLSGDVDIYDPLLSEQYKSEARKEATQREYTSKWFGGAEWDWLGGNVGNFVYNTGTSMLENLVNMGTAYALGNAFGLGGEALNSFTAEATSAIMGSDVAANTILQAKRSGDSDGIAIARGVSAGLAEWATERWSIEQILNGNLFKAGVSEASEELASNWINRDIDKLLRPATNDTAMNFYKYLNEGESPKQALADAFFDDIKDDFQSGLSGFVSGIGMGAGFKAMNNARISSIGNQFIKGGYTNSLISQALNTDANSESYKMATKMAQELTEGKKLSGKEVGNLLATYQSEGNTFVMPQKTYGIPEVLTEYSQVFDDNGQNVFNKFYVEGQSPTEYAREMSIVYNAGLEGKAMPKTESILTEQAKAMYEAGKVDSQVNTEYNKTKGVDKNASTRGQDYRQSGEWNDSSDTEGQIPAMEEGTGRNAEVGQVDLRQGDRGQADGKTQITAKQLGISDGDDRSTVTIETEYKGKDEVEKIAKEHGLKVVAFSGDNLSFTQDGREFFARGAIENGTIYVRTDHAEFTPAQIAKHEVTHERVNEGRINIARVKERVKDLTKGKIHQLAQAYATAFKGSGMTENEIFEEIVCDSEAEMNIFKHRFESRQEAFAELRQTVRSVVQEDENATRGSPENEISSLDADYTKFSRVTDLTPEQEAETERQIDELIEKYGKIEKGETPAREVAVPKKTAKDKKVSETVRTILEAKATPEVVVPTIQKLVADGEYSYTAYSDEDAIKNATAKIENRGWDKAYSDWVSDARKGKISKSNTAMGWALYNNAANSGNAGTALDILSYIIKQQRNAAQALQATRILKTLSPESQLYGVARSIQDIQEGIDKRFGQGKYDLKINEELAQQFVNETDPIARDKILKEIYKDIGRQIPASWVDKFNAWRYMAMLTNPSTHIRNILGNLGFMPLVLTKDKVATAIQGAVRMTGKDFEQTKSFISRHSTLYKAAKADYENIRDIALGGGKYDESQIANDAIREGQIIFKTKWLEAIRKINSWLLDIEDVWFSKPHYAIAMAQYCKANGITAEQIESGEGLDRARAYAIREAQKGTYRDTNAFSQAVQSLGKARNSKNIFAKGASYAVEGVLPFKKTPANILVRGVEYSPIGILTSIGKHAKKLHSWKADFKKGNITQEQLNENVYYETSNFIDDLSAGLTGTGLMALGILLSSLGIVELRGKEDEDDKKRKFDKLTGHQKYSIEIGGYSVTLDWLAPEALPFFTGVELYNAKATDNMNMSEIMNIVNNISSPMLENSFLQGVNDLFENISYARQNDMNPLTTVLSGAATNYLTQFVPTIGGKFERTTEDKRMTTFVKKDGFLTRDVQYLLGKVSQKIPYWDYQQMPYIDLWGREESTGNVADRFIGNFINPGYIKKIEESPMEKELLRLYDKTGKRSVFPDTVDKTIKVGGEDVVLNQNEYVAYQKSAGQTAYKLVTEMTESKLYKALNDADKVAMISDCYTYAKAVAAKGIKSKYEVTSWVSEAEQINKNTKFPVSSYILMKSYMNANIKKGMPGKDGTSIDGTRGLLRMEYINSITTNSRQRRALYEAFDVGDSVIDYNEERVKQTLADLRSGKIKSIPKSKKSSSSGNGTGLSFSGASSGGSSGSIKFKLN